MSQEYQVLTQQISISVMRDCSGVDIDKADMTAICGDITVTNQWLDISVIRDTKGLKIRGGRQDAVRGSCMIDTAILEEDPVIEGDEISMCYLNFIKHRSVIDIGTR